MNKCEHLAIACIARFVMELFCHPFVCVEMLKLVEQNFLCFSSELE